MAAFTHRCDRCGFEWTPEDKAFNRQDICPHCNAADFYSGVHAVLTPPTSGLDMRVVLAITITAEDAPTVFADICTAVESCMKLVDADWNTDNGTAVFRGTTDVSLATITATLYSSAATKERVRSITYRQPSK